MVGPHNFYDKYRGKAVVQTSRLDGLLPSRKHYGFPNPRRIDPVARRPEEELMFESGTVVRLRNDPSCAGQITGASATRGGRIYREVQLADGSGKRMLPEAQLDAGTAAPDPLGDLEAGRFADFNLLRRGTPIKSF